MNRQEKQQIINAIRTSFSDSRASFLVGVQGLPVKDVQKLRRKVRAEGGQVNVVKNTLLEQAVDGMAGVQELRPHFRDQIAVVFAFKEFAPVARAINEVAKERENLKIIAGYFEGQVADAARVKYLATLPSREQLLAQICGGLNATIAKLAYVLKAVSEKQQQSVSSVNE